MFTRTNNWKPSAGGWCLVCALALGTVSAGAQAADDNAPAQSDPAGKTEADSQPVDPAVKQMMKANGLLRRNLYKLAAEEYRGFLADHPNHAKAPEARYELGLCLYSLHDFAAAIEPLQSALKDPKLAHRDAALLTLGYCQLADKHYAQADTTFATLLSQYPTSDQAESASIYQIQALYLDKRNKQAADAAGKFIARYPKSQEVPTALYFTALADRAQSDNASAAQALQRLATDFPDSRYKLDATLLLGQTLEAQGKLDGAIEQYRKLLANAPEARKADACYSLGLALYKAGKYDESAKQLATVVDGFPSSLYFKSARLQLGLAQLAAGKIPEARKTLSLAAHDDAAAGADSATAQYGLAECDIAEKKYAAAYDALDALAKLSPAPANLPRILLDRAACLMSLNKFEQASGELAAYLTSYPTSPAVPEATYREAFCLHRLKKYDQSHALCERLAQGQPTALSGPAAELDAENLFLLAKYPEAREAFAKLAKNAAQAKDERKSLRYAFRQGQCEYFGGHFDQAVAILTPVAQAHPTGVQDADIRNDIARASFLTGDALLQLGKSTEAIAFLKQYLAVAKTDLREARYKLALAEARSNNADGAIATLSQLIGEPADDPWVQRGLLEAGQLDYKAKRTGPAVDALNRLLAAKPLPELVAPANYLLAFIDFDAKRYDAAASKWKSVAAQSADPKLASDAAFQEAVALKEAGKTDEALGAVQAFARLHPDDAPRANQLAASTLYDLAWSQRDHNKDLPAAVATYRKLIDLQPHGKLAPSARTELAELLYDQKKYADAAGLLSEVTADKSADPKVAAIAQYKLGWCQEKLGQDEQAAATFSAFAAAHPDDPKLTPSALLEAGSDFSGQGRFEQAEKSLKTLMEKFPAYADAPVALLKLANAQAQQQEYDASLKSYQQFLDKYPKSQFAYRANFGAGWALENLKKYDEARAEYKKVIAASNGEFAARAQFQIGETYLGEQKFEPAIKELLAVDDVYAYPKWSARALFEAGRAFEQLKQPDQAKRQYSQVISKYKTAPEADAARERLKAM